ncbi:hypothetical protein O1611_g10203 [Lasiodiplodia mahajangana]|uniref:Uncharacterized protein n=1 Tax=Lasiodiplodia mahajangana TaxID=1108764 RepID=A0ACC2J1K3_9PEZI|nr:hypothetical protein O1611_g10203 [Lasiodiplodia mahajangana]
MAMAMGEEYHVRVVAIGSELSIFVDDMNEAKIRFTDASFTTGANGVRVFNAAARFGSVSVARPQQRSSSLKRVPSFIDRDDSSGDEYWYDTPDKPSGDPEVEMRDDTRPSLSFLCCGANRLFRINRNPKP